MRDYYEFETTPSEEPCQSLGRNYDQVMARKEAKTLIKQLERMFTIPEGSFFKVKSDTHEFGDYYSIHYVFDTDDITHIDFCDELDENFPQHWDEQAKIDLSA